MKKHINQLWVVVLAIIFLLNAFLFISALFNPFFSFFARPEFSEMNETTRNIISGSLTILYIAIVNSCLIIILVLKKSNKTKILISLTMTLFALALVFIPRILYPYPDTIEEYTKNGYVIRIHSWYKGADTVTTEKHYRSEQPINYYTDPNKIKWLLYKKTK